MLSKACNKCGGDLYIEEGRDRTGSYAELTCLQCGNHRDLDTRGIMQLKHNSLSLRKAS